MSFNRIVSQMYACASAMGEELVKETTTAGPVALSADLFIFGMYAGAKAIRSFAYFRYEEGMVNVAWCTTCFAGSYFSLYYLFDNKCNPHTLINRDCHIWFDKESTRVVSQKCVYFLCTHFNTKNQHCVYSICARPTPGIMDCSFDE